MSDRVICMSDGPMTSTRVHPGFSLRRLYVPATTAVLVLLLGSWLVQEAEPLVSLRPEQRTETAMNPELTPEEAKLAHAVIEPGFASRGGREQILFIGNSQTMAIPYGQPWDITTPQWFQVLLSRRAPGAVDVHRGSLGGMSLAEVMVRGVAFGESVPKPAAVIVAIHPDLINRLSIQDKVRKEAQQPVVAGKLESLAENNSNCALAAKTIAAILSREQDSATGAEHKQSWPRRLEDSLQSEAESLKVFAERELFLELLNDSFRRLRNQIFGITSASPRPLDNATYRANLENLELILKYGREKNISVVLYLAPVRHIQPAPDSPQDLARIRRDLRELAGRYNVECLDYTNLVPERYWTNYEPNGLNKLTGDAGQPDFAHLRAPAHKMIAEKLLQDVGDSILFQKAATH